MSVDDAPFEQWYPPLKVAEDDKQIAVATAAHYTELQLSPAHVIELCDMVIARHHLLRRVVEVVNRASAHRFDFQGQPPPAPDAPAGGPDDFYNGVRYVVNKVRQAMLTTPALLRLDQSGPVSFAHMEATADDRAGRALDAIRETLRMETLSPAERVARAFTILESHRNGDM